METDPLEVHDLPSDPREMALRLLGMTVSELKQIDDKVISGKQYVGGVKTDINKIAQDVAINLAPKPVANTIMVQSLDSTPVVETITQIPHTQSLPAILPCSPDAGRDQMEFDFYRKIKPEDIEFQLKKINATLDDLTHKVDLIYATVIKKNSRKINGNHSQ
jgi:hypothetical protein